MRHVPVLRHRQFRLLFAGRAVSVIGDALLPVALAFAVLDELDAPRRAGSSPRSSRADELQEANRPACTRR